MLRCECTPEYTSTSSLGESIDLIDLYFNSSTFYLIDFLLQWKKECMILYPKEWKKEIKSCIITRLYCIYSSICFRYFWLKQLSLGRNLRSLTLATNCITVHISSLDAHSHIHTLYYTVVWNKTLSNDQRKCPLRSPHTSWYDVFTCETWRTHTWNITHSHANSFMWSETISPSIAVHNAIWYIHMWHTTHSYMKHNTFIWPSPLPPTPSCNVTWRIHKWNMTHSKMRFFDRLLLYAMTHSYLCHDMFACETV